MGSHDNIRLMVPDLLVGRALLLRRHGPGHQDSLLVNAVIVKKPAHALIVLSGQHLRRCHECPLISVEGRRQQA